MHVDAVTTMTAGMTSPKQTSPHPGTRRLSTVDSGSEVSPIVRVLLRDGS